MNTLTSRYRVLRVDLKAAAHLANAEQPETFNRVVTTFLEKVGTGGEGLGNGSRPGGAAS